MRKLFIFSFLLPFVSAQAQTKDLEYYIQTASANSPLLKDYVNQIEAYKIDSLKIKAGKRPQVNAFSNLMQAPTINNIGYDEAITNGGLYSAGISVAKPLLIGKIQKAEYESVSVQTNVVKNAEKLSRHDLEKQITDQYITAFQDNLQYNFTETIVSTLGNETQILKELFKKGVGKQSDYMSVDLELQSQQIILEQLKTQYHSDLLLLNALCGIADTNTIQLKAPDLQLKYKFDPVYSPFFYKFSLDSLGIENQRRLVGTKYLPRFNFVGDAGLNSSQLTGIEKRFGFSLGLNFSMPIYDGHQKDLDLKKLDFSQSSREAYQSYFQKRFKLQLQQIQAEIIGNDKIIAKLQQQLKDEEILLKLQRQQLINGLTSTVEYVLVLRSYLETNNELNKTMVNKQLLISENNYWTW